MASTVPTNILEGEILRRLCGGGGQKWEGRV